MKKLILNKEIISNVTNDEMKKIKGGIVDDRELEAFGSRLLCFSISDWGCDASKSCDSIICIPGR